MYTNLDKNLQQLIDKAQTKIAPVFADCDRRAEELQWKVLSSFRRHRVSEAHLNASTGYGYNDIGRDALEQIFADCMGTEFAMKRLPKRKWRRLLQHSLGQNMQAWSTSQLRNIPSSSR